MFRDQSLILSDAQAVALAAASTSANTYKQSDGTRDEDEGGHIGIGEPLYLIVQPNGEYTAGVLEVELRNADRDGSNVVVLGTVRFTAAELIANQVVPKYIYVPPSEAKKPTFSVGYNPTTALVGDDGRVSAWLSPTIEGYQEIKSGFTIDTTGTP